MRNWNFSMGERIWFPSWMFLLYLWGIETGDWNKRCSPYSGSFYFTYEELKLAKIVAKIVQRIVFTLPMRNWNWRLEQKMFSVLWKFLLYLWGIETIINVELYYYQHSFYFTYEELKRFKIGMDSCLVNKVFTLPMRNWNIRIKIYM